MSIAMGVKMPTHFMISPLVIRDHAAFPLNDSSQFAAGRMLQAARTVLDQREMFREGKGCEDINSSPWSLRTEVEVACCGPFSIESPAARLRPLRSFPASIGSRHGLLEISFLLP